MAEQYEPNDVNAVLSRIETRIENKAILDAERWQRMQAWMQLSQKQAEKQDERIAALENWRWYVIGIAVGLGVVIKAVWK